LILALALPKAQRHKQSRRRQIVETATKDALKLCLVNGILGTAAFSEVRYIK